MTFSPTNVIAVIVAALLAVGGWTARGWYEDSKDLAAAQAIEKSREVMRDLANEVSGKTETAIQGIRVENRTIYQQASKEVVSVPVYSECLLPADGVRRANQARRGAAAGKPDDKVPGAVAAP